MVTTRICFFHRNTSPCAIAFFTFLLLQSLLFFLFLTGLPRWLYLKYLESDAKVIQPLTIKLLHQMFPLMIVFVRDTFATVFTEFPMPSINIRCRKIWRKEQTERGKEGSRKELNPSSSLLKLLASWVSPPLGWSLHLQHYLLWRTYYLLQPLVLGASLLSPFLWLSYLQVGAPQDSLGLPTASWFCVTKLQL